MIKTITMAAAAIALSSTFAVAATPKLRYEFKRLGGSRSDIYMPVRVDQPKAANTPHVPMVQPQPRSERRRVLRYVGGPHNIPLWMHERK